MPVNITYTEDGGIIIKGEGCLTGSDILEANDIIYDSPEKIKTIVYQICDLTDISEVTATLSEVHECARQDKKASKINPTMLIAVVGEQDLLYGLSRMWQSLADGAPEAMVFKKMTEAQQWVSNKLLTMSQQVTDEN